MLHALLDVGFIVESWCLPLLTCSHRSLAVNASDLCEIGECVGDYGQLLRAGRGSLSSLVIIHYLCVVIIVSMSKSELVVTVVVIVHGLGSLGPLIETASVSPM